MSTPRFRKSDQYYEDEYDRLTISLMKEKEDEWTAKLKLITDEDLLFKKQMVAHIYWFQRNHDSSHGMLFVKKY